MNGSAIVERKLKFMVTCSHLSLDFDQFTLLFKKCPKMKNA